MKKRILSMLISAVIIAGASVISFISDTEATPNQITLANYIATANVSGTVGTNDNAGGIYAESNALKMNGKGSDTDGIYGFGARTASYHWGNNGQINKGGSYGTSNIWGVTTTSSRNLLTQTFADDKDTQGANSQNGLVFDKQDGIYVYEAEFLPISRGANNRYTYKFIGNDDSEIISLYLDRTNASLTKDGTAVSGAVSRAFPIANASGTGAGGFISTASANLPVGYLKIIFDFKNHTLSAWIVQRKTSSGTYSETQPTDQNLLIKDYNFGSGITKLAKTTIVGVYDTAQYGFGFTFIKISEIPAEDIVSAAKTNFDSNLILNTNTALNNITDDIIFPSNFDNADISWSSSDTNIISNIGAVERPVGADASVTLTPVFSRWAKSAEGTPITVTVKARPAPPSAAEILDRAADMLLWTDYTSEPQSGVTHALTQLPSSKIAFGETAIIEWSIFEGGANAVISGSTVNISREEFVNIKVTLRATLKYGSQNLTKDFIFYINKTQSSDLIYVDEDYAAQQDGVVGANDDITLDVSETADRYVKYVNGNGLIAYNSAAGAETAATATIDLKAKANKNKLLEEFNNYESDVVLEFTIQPKGINAYALSTHFYVLDDNDNQIVYWQFTNGSTASNTVDVNMKYNDAWQTYPDKTALTNKVRAGVSGGSFPAVKFKMIYNRMTNKYTVYGKLASEAEAAYLKIADNVSPNTPLPPSGAQMAKFRISTRSKTSTTPQNSGAIILKNIKVYTNEDIVKDYILNSSYKALILNGQTENGVVGNLLVPYIHYGTSVNLGITNSGAAIFDNGGKLLADFNPGEVRGAVVSPVVKFTKTKLNNVEVPLVPFGITVKGVAKNLLYNKAVSVVGAAADTGSKLTDINDGFYDTAFVTVGNETAFSVTFDLTKPEEFNKLTLREGLISGAYNIKSWSFEASDNKNASAWTKLLQGGAIGEQLPLTIPQPQKYRYARLNIESKITPGAKVAIAEVMLDFDPDDDYRHAKDFEKLQAPPSSVSADFYVQGKGEIYQSDVKWESFDTSVLSVATAIEADTSSPNFEKYKISCIRPSQSKDVTLKATIGKNTINYTVRVIGLTSDNQSSNTGLSGGSGGGGRTGVSSSGGATVYNPDNSGSNAKINLMPPKASRYFNDMANAEWAVQYVDFLKEKDIISGDENGDFNPQNRVTREEFAKMIVLSLGFEPVYDIKLPFNDVDKNHWAYPYIAAAYKNGLIFGISESAFGKGNSILRQDIAAIIARAVDVFGKYNSSSSIKFNDEGDIDGYAVDFVKKLADIGVLGGDDSGNFRPKDTATRAESAKVLYKLFEL